jgi:single-strand DNA-binding protein
MNTVQLIGRLTADPDFRITPNGHNVCRMRLAVPGARRDQTPVFVDVEAWNKTAEACDRHLEKGRRVSVQGRLGHDQWQTDNGSKRQRHYIVAASVQFLDPRPSGVHVEADPEPEREEELIEL